MIEMSIYGRASNEHINGNGQRIGLGFGQLAYTEGFAAAGGAEMNVRSYPAQMPDSRGAFPVLFSMYKQPVGEGKEPVQILQTNYRIMDGQNRHIAHQYAAIGEASVKGLLTYPLKWMMAYYEVRPIDRVSYPVKQLENIQNRNIFELPSLSDTLRYFGMGPDGFENLLCSLFESVKNEYVATVVLIDTRRPNWFTPVRALLVHIYRFLPISMRREVGFETWFTGKFLSGAINLCFYRHDMFYEANGRYMLRIRPDSSGSYDVTDMPVFRGNQAAGKKVFGENSTYRAFIHPWIEKIWQNNQNDEEEKLNSLWMWFHILPDGQTTELDGFSGLLEYKRLSEGGALPDLDELPAWAAKFCSGMGVPAKDLLAQKLEGIGERYADRQEQLVEVMIELLDEEKYGSSVYEIALDVWREHMHDVPTELHKLPRLLGLRMEDEDRIRLVQTAKEAGSWEEIVFALLLDMLQIQGLSDVVKDTIYTRLEQNMPSAFEPTEKTDGILKQAGAVGETDIHPKKVCALYCRNVHPSISWTLERIKDTLNGKLMLTDEMLINVINNTKSAEESDEVARWEDSKLYLEMLLTGIPGSAVKDAIYARFEKTLPIKFEPTKETDQILQCAGAVGRTDVYLKKVCALYSRNVCPDIRWALERIKDRLTEKLTLTDEMLIQVLNNAKLAGNVWNDIREVLLVLPQNGISKPVKDALFGFIQRVLPMDFTPEHLAHQTLDRAMLKIYLPEAEYRERYTILFLSRMKPDLDWVCANLGEVLKRVGTAEVRKAAEEMVERLIAGAKLSVNRSAQLIGNVCKEFGDEAAEKLVTEIVAGTGYEDGDRETVDLYLDLLKAYTEGRGNKTEISEYVLKWLFGNERLGKIERLKAALKWQGEDGMSEEFHKYFEEIRSMEVLSEEELFDLMDGYERWPESNGIREDVAGLILSASEKYSLDSNNITKIAEKLNKLPYALKEQCVRALLRSQKENSTVDSFYAVNMLWNEPEPQTKEAAFELLKQAASTETVNGRMLGSLTDIALRAGSEINESIEALDALLTKSELENMYVTMLSAAERTSKELPEYCAKIEKKLLSELGLRDRNAGFMEDFGTEAIERLGMRSADMLCVLLRKTADVDAEKAAALLLKTAKLSEPLTGICEAAERHISAGKLSLETASALLNACEAGKLEAGQSFAEMLLRKIAECGGSKTEILKVIAGCTLVSEEQREKTVTDVLASREVTLADLAEWNTCADKVEHGYDILRLLIKNVRQKNNECLDPVGLSLLIRYRFDNDEALAKPAKKAYERLMENGRLRTFKEPAKVLWGYGYEAADEILTELIKKTDIAEAPDQNLADAIEIYDRWENRKAWRKTTKALKTITDQAMSRMDIHTLLSRFASESSELIQKSFEAHVGTAAAELLQSAQETEGILRKQYSVNGYVSPSILCRDIVIINQRLGENGDGTLINMIGCLRYAEVGSLTDMLDTVLSLRSKAKQGTKWAQAIDELITASVYPDSFKNMEPAKLPEKFEQWMTALLNNGVSYESSSVNVMLKAVIQARVYKFQDISWLLELINKLPKSRENYALALRICQAYQSSRMNESYQYYRRNGGWESWLKKLEDACGKIYDEQVSMDLFAYCVCRAVKDEEPKFRIQMIQWCLYSELKDHDTELWLRFGYAFVHVFRELGILSEYTQEMDAIGYLIRQHCYENLLDIQKSQKLFRDSNTVKELDQNDLQELLKEVFSHLSDLKKDNKKDQLRFVFDGTLKEKLSNLRREDSMAYRLYLEWRVKLAARWSLYAEESKKCLFKMLEIKASEDILIGFLCMIQGTEDFLTNLHDWIIVCICLNYVSIITRNGDVEYLLQYPKDRENWLDDILKHDYPAEEFAVRQIYHSVDGSKTYEEWETDWKKLEKTDSNLYLKAADIYLESICCYYKVRTGKKDRTEYLLWYPKDSENWMEDIRKCKYPAEAFAIRQTTRLVKKCTTREEWNADWQKLKQSNPAIYSKAVDIYKSQLFPVFKRLNK